MKTQHVISVVGVLLLLNFVYFVSKQPSTQKKEVPLAMRCPEFDNVGPFSVDVTWPPALKGAQYHVIRYELYVKRLPHEEYHMVYSGHHRNVTVKNLQPNVRHKMTVLSFNKNGQSPIGCEAEVTTMGNVIKNAGFELQGPPKYPFLGGEEVAPESDLFFADWEPYHWGYLIEDNPSRCHSGNKCLRTDGNSDRDAFGALTHMYGATQFVHLNQTTATPLTISAWTKSVDVTGPPDDGYAVSLDIKYADGTTLLGQSLQFATDTHEWHSNCLIVEPVKPIASVSIFIIAADKLGQMWFDDISLTPGYGKDPSSDNTCRTRCVFGGRTRGDCFRVEELFIQAKEDPDVNAVSIATQLSTERLVRLREMSRVWQGPISATVYIKDREKDIAAIMELKQSAGSVVDNIDFHIMFASDGPYPINTLRNVAIRHCRTEYVFLLDVDFIPNPKMRQTLTPLLPQLQEKKVFVVPAFEMTDMSFGLPGDKTALNHLAHHQKLRQVHQFYRPAHGATNYSHWYTTDEVYEAFYELNYEPYVIASKEIPWYDERFAGYGHDKSSHSYELDRAGYSFYVLPEAFVIHIDHGAPPWREQRDQTRIWRNWYDFIFELDVKYGEKADTAYNGPAMLLASDDPATKASHESKVQSYLANFQNMFGDDSSVGERGVSGKGGGRKAKGGKKMPLTQQLMVMGTVFLILMVLVRYYKNRTVELAHTE